MPKKINFIQITLLFILFTLAEGCQSHTTAIEKNLSPAEYFQLARDATVEGNYRLALAYYESFIDQYNSNHHRNEIHRLLWADYEIAFLHHKMNNDEKAIDLLNKLIARYETDDSDNYPIGPKNLSLRVITELNLSQKSTSE